MANRMKEDERIERIIRSLLKLPENRRCINCNSMGPQYVCTNFLTFVCTNCSGVHREFTHRVKSVSMAKFSAEEVSALQAGGNERARKIYFKAWDAQCLPYPDACNLQRLRDFIKHVYVDRKYTGEKSVDNLPRLRLNDKEESCGSKKGSAYHGGSRSSLSEDRYEGRYSKRSSPVQRSEGGSSKYYYDERRCPRHAQENSRYGGFRRSPARFEVIDDRFRDDECGSRRFSSADSKIGIRSLGLLKNMERASSPVARPVRDNLGDGVPHLEGGKLSKATNAKDTAGSSHNQLSSLQNIASTSDECSIDRNPAEHKRRSSGSLIDLSPEGHSLDAEIIIQTPQMLQADSGGTWPSFEHPAKEKAFQARSAVSFESVLIELSVPSVLPASDSMSEGPSIDDALSTAARGNFPASGTSPSASAQHMSAITINVGASTTASTTNNIPAEPHDESPPQVAPIGDVDSTIAIADRQQLSNMQQYHPTTSLVSDGSPIMQLTNPPVGALNNQPWNSSNRPNRQWPPTAYAQQSSQAISKSAQDTGSGVQSEPLSMETTSIGRKELPADLFTASYSTVTAPVTGRQNETGSPYGMGVSMLYYPNTMPMHAFPNTARSINPFDLNGERTHVQAPPFPSMASLQGALPNVSAASSLFQTSRPGTQSSGLMAPLSPSYASAMPPGPSMGIHVQNNMTPSRSQGLSGFGSDGVLGHLNTTQQSTGECSAPSTPNPFSSIGGNPFG